MIRLLPVTCLVFHTLACTGTDTGNPVVDVDFALLESQPAGIDNAWLAVERIRLRSASACNGAAEAEFPGPFAIDLLSPGAIPELSGLEVPGTDYCRFEVEWDAFASELPPTAPPELGDASIVLMGARGDGTRFVLRSARNDELRLDAVDGAFTIDEATSALFVGLDSAGLLAGIDLDAAVVAGDGIIHIDDDDNSDLLDIFDDNVDAASRLFDDDDGDGNLEPDETDPDDVLAE